MAALFVSIMKKIHDHELLGEYRSKARQSLSPFAPQVVAGALVEALEGDSPDAFVVLRFDSVEQIKAWYYSPEYQAIQPMRARAADCSVFLVEAVD